MSQFQKLYILGSGFSKSFSARMPTMQDLTDRLFELDDPEYANLTAFAWELYRKSNYLEEFKDMENLANIIFSKQIFTDFQEQLDYEKLRFELIKFIYREINQQELDSSKAKTLYEFLRQSASPTASDHCVLLNFNYDLIIEDVLKQKARQRPEQIALKYGLQFERYEPDKTIDNTRQALRYLTMLKLHGSFNWFRAKGSTANDIRNIHLVHQEDSSFSIHANDIPTYIPMTNVKSQFLTGTLYNTLWAKAIDYLNNCDEIVLIGYGFPKTDLNNLGLFLDYKHKIKTINVNHPDGSEKLNRLKQAFGESVVKNQDAKTFIEEEILKGST